RFEEIDAAQQRRLARPARTDQADHLMLLHLEVDPFEHLEAVERLAHALEPDRLGHTVPPAIRRRRCRSRSQSVNLVIGIVMIRKQMAAPTNGVKLKSPALTRWARRNASTENADTNAIRAVSFWSEMKSFINGGTTRRTACGITTERSDCQRVR